MLGLRLDERLLEIMCYGIPLDLPPYVELKEINITSEQLKDLFNKIKEIKNRINAPNLSFSNWFIEQKKKFSSGRDPSKYIQLDDCP